MGYENIHCLNSDFRCVKLATFIIRGVYVCVFVETSGLFIWGVLVEIKKNNYRNYFGKSVSISSVISLSHVLMFARQIYTYKCKYIQESTDSHTNACMHTYKHACIHAYMHTYIQPYTHARTQSRTHIHFDALVQASDFQIERRQVVFRCWMQDLNQGLWNRISSRLNVRWQTDWANLTWNYCTSTDTAILYCSVDCSTVQYRISFL